VNGTSQSYGLDRERRPFAWHVSGSAAASIEICFAASTAVQKQ
jgi:hypothetical protein